MSVKNPFLVREVKYFKDNGCYIKYEYKGNTYILNRALCVRPKCAEDIAWLSERLGKEPVINEAAYIGKFMDRLDLEHGCEVTTKDFTLTDITIDRTKFKAGKVNYSLYGNNYSTLFNSEYVMTLFRFSDRVVVTVDEQKTVVLCGLDKDNVLTGFCFPVRSDQHIHKLGKFVTFD